MEKFDYEPMDMPTPCEHCGKIFDLNDGRASEKWHENIIICKECWEKEQEEIEEDDRLYEVNLEVSNALYGFDKEGAWAELTDENRALIIQCVRQRFSEMKDIEPEFVDIVNEKFWDLF